MGKISLVFINLAFKTQCLFVKKTFSSPDLFFGYLIGAHLEVQEAHPPNSCWKVKIKSESLYLIHTKIYT